MSARGRLRLGLIAGGLLVLLAIPWTRRTIAAEAILKPFAQMDVQAPEDGIVTQVLVHEGDSVERGQPLFRVSSPSVEAEAGRSLSERERFSKKSSGSRSVADAAMTFQSDSRASAAQTALEAARYRERFLLVRSPIQGRILTPRTQDLEGRFVVVGYPLAQVGDCRKMVAEVPVSERLLEYLKVGASVSARVKTNSWKTYPGSIAAISPATLDQPATASGKDLALPSTQPERFIAMVVLDNTDGDLVPRSAVRVKIRSFRESYVSRAWNVFWRWLRSVLW